MKSIITRTFTQCSECLCPPEICILKSQHPNVMVLVAGAFERCSCPEGRGPMDDIGRLLKGAPESSLAPSTVWGCIERVVALNEEEGLHQNATALVPWILNLLASSKTVSNTFLMFISHLVSGVLLWLPEWTRKTHMLSTQINFSCKYFTIFGVCVCVCMYVFSWAIESMLWTPWHFSLKYLSMDLLRARKVSYIIILPLSHLRKLIITFNIYLIFKFLQFPPKFSLFFQTRSQVGFANYICLFYLFWSISLSLLLLFFFPWHWLFKENSLIACRMIWIWLVFPLRYPLTENLDWTSTAQ